MVTLRGVVTDTTGAVGPGATVTANGPSGARTATSASDGSYTFVGLPSGDYTVQASAPDLALAQPSKISLRSGTGLSTASILLTATDLGPSRDFLDCDFEDLRDRQTARNI